MMLSGLQSWLRKNIGEIQGDRALRIYGSMVALTHVFSFMYWKVKSYSLILGSQAEPLCWPFFENCRSFRILTSDQLDVYLWAYLAVAVVSAVLFLRPKNVPYAYFTLIGVNLLKFGFMCLDFRTRMNPHLMAMWVNLIFLFLPYKRETLRMTIVLFYFWAATLKFNREWLSGAVFYKPLWFFRGALLRWGCAYVVVLEFIIVWGILASGAWIFWTTFAQLVTFHIVSFWEVGFFYPLLMFAILSIFLLCRFLPKDQKPRGSLLKELFTGKARLATYGVMGMFSLLQLFPQLFPGDTAVTGEGRLFSLHMYDARIVCGAKVRIRDRQGHFTDRDIHWDLVPRIVCDPIVYWNRARTLCREEQRSAKFLDLDLILDSRKTTETKLRPVVRLTDFCQRNPKYSVFRHNDWILSH